MQKGCGVLRATRDRISRGYNVGPWEKGIDGSQDVFIATDIYSGLRVAYPAPDKTAESTDMALRSSVGSRIIRKMYADRSGVD